MRAAALPSFRVPARPLGLLGAILLLAGLSARAQDGVDAKALTGHRGAVLSVTFNDDGKLLASCDAGGTVKVWDMEKGVEARSAPGAAGISSMAFHGESLAVGGSFRDTEGYWRGDIAVFKGDAQVTLEGVQTRVTSLAMTDGRLAAGGAMTDYERGGEFGIVQLWGGDAGAPVRDLRLGYGETVHSVAFTQDGQWLLAGSGGAADANLGKATLWNLSNYQAQEIARIRGVVHSVAFSADALVFAGVKIAGGRKVGFITVREFGTDREETREGAPWLNAPVRCVAFSPDGEGFAAGSGNAVLLWKRGEENPMRLATRGVVQSLAFGKDALVAGSSDGTITVWTRREEAPALPLVFTVVDAANGSPLPDVLIELFAEGSKYVGGGPAGTYPFTVPAPGRFKVTVSKDGYVGQTLTVAAGDEGGRHTVRLQRTAPTPQPRTLVLSVVDGADGKPVSAPTITVSGGATAKGSGRDGTHTYTVPDAGSYGITVEKEGYQRATRKVEVGARDVRIVVRLERTAPTPQPLALLVSVVEAADEGRQVRDAAVRVARDQASPVKGADGTYQCTVPQAGTYLVSVRKDGYVPLERQVGVAAAGQREIVKLVRALALDVVDDETNEPVPDCTLEVRGKALDHLRDGDTYRCVLASGKHTVSVRKDGYVAETVPIDVRAAAGTGGTSAEIRLRKAAFTLTVRVRDAGNGPVAGLEVDAPASGKASEPTPGSYTLRLRPGTYEVEAAKGTEAFPSRRVTITSEDVVLDLAPARADTRDAARSLRRQLDTDGNLRVEEKDFSPDAWKEIAKHDTNGDGELNEGELAALGSALSAPAPLGPALRALVAPAPDPQESADRLLAVLDWNGDGQVDEDDFEPEDWSGLRPHDRNGDGRIDRTECAALAGTERALAALAPRDILVEQVQSFADDLPDQLERCLDCDADGRVAKADFEESAWAELRRLDTDGDEELSREELRALRPAPPAPLLKTDKTTPTRGVLKIRRISDG